LEEFFKEGILIYEKHFCKNRFSSTYIRTTMISITCIPEQQAGRLGRISLRYTRMLSETTFEIILRRAYEFMNDYADLGHLKAIRNTDLNFSYSYYLLHQTEIKQSASERKICVFNAFLSEHHYY